MPNGKLRRRHEFFFSPRDYLNDPAVLAMTTLARGAYSTLLFALWDMDEPGVSPADPLVLAALARATAEEWAEVEAQVARAFDLDSRPGFWVQKRLAYEHQRQQGQIHHLATIGRLGRNKQLAGNPRADPGRTPGLTQVTQVSQVASVESKSTHLSDKSDVNGLEKNQKVKNLLAKPAPERLEWEEGFREDFWKLYPRKVGKPGALRAWAKLMPKALADQPQALEAVCSGLERWIAYWREHETPEDKIPHPATFLNDLRHEDYPS